MKTQSFLGNFLAELRRREVIKTCIAYLGVSWVVLQVLDVASQMLIVPVIVGTFMFIFLLCLFPVLLYISWHFDLTKNGWKRTAELEVNAEGQPVLQRPFGWGSWLGLGATLVLCLAIGFQYFNVVKDRQAAEEEGLAKVIVADSIAILPFTDQSPDKDQAYLAVGLAEELTSLLGQTDGFRVAASRSTKILSDKGLPAVDIGRRLKVQTILTGTVVKVGNRVKIRVELLNTENGHTLWTENFMRELIDIFDLQAEIGRSVVNLLRDKYLEAGSLRSLSATSSTDAYIMYLKGREAYRKQTAEGMKEARKLFEQAVALDPEYAQAYVGLADTLVMLSEGSEYFGILKTDIATRLAEANIEKAILRELNLPEAFAVKGWLDYTKGLAEESLSSFEKAIKLNPSLAIAYMWQYKALDKLGRFDESIEALEQAKKLDPLFTSINFNLGFELSRRGRFEQAKSIFTQMILDFPESPLGHRGLAEIAYANGHYALSLKHWKVVSETSPEDLEYKRSYLDVLFQLNMIDKLKILTNDPTYQVSILLRERSFEKLFEEMDFQMAANPADPWVMFEAGWYQAMFGQTDKALVLLQKTDQGVDENDRYYMPYCTPAIEAAWAYKIGKNELLFQERLQACESRYTSGLNSALKNADFDYLGVRIAALTGDNELAISRLTKAIAQGWREWWTQFDPLLQSLRELPEFQAQLDIIEQDLAQQKIEALKLFEAE
jgi:TolB-like protein/Tfp pilus assembly protein PilF